MTGPTDSGVGAWTKLGGENRGLPGVVTTLTPDGKRRVNEVYIRGDNTHVYYKSKKDSKWGERYTALGGTVTGNMTAISWGPDRSDVFAVDVDGSVAHRHRTGNKWADWENIGGQDLKIAGDVTAISYHADRIDIFVNSANNGHVYHKAWVWAAWSPSKEGWNDIGGQATGNVAAVVGPASGSFHLFTRSAGTPSVVLSKSWTASKFDPAGGGTWSPSVSEWTRDNHELDVKHDVAAASVRQGHLAVFAIDQAGTLQTRSGMDGNWPAWAPMPAIGAVGIVSAPAAIAYNDALTGRPMISVGVYVHSGAVATIYGVSSDDGSIRWGEWGFSTVLDPDPDTVQYMRPVLDVNGRVFQVVSTNTNLYTCVMVHGGPVLPQKDEFVPIEGPSDG